MVLSEGDKILVSTLHLQSIFY